MTIERTLLTAGSSTTNGTSFDTDSFDHQADTLVMAWLTITAGTSPAPVPDLSGHGITWELQARPNDSARSLFLFVGTAASGNSGPLTITTATAATSALWVIVELTGVDISGGASAALLQTFTDQQNTNSFTMTLAAPVTGDNHVVSAWQNAVQETAAVTSPGVEVAQQSQTAPTSTMIVGYRDDGGDSLTFTTSTASLGRGILVEIIAAAGASPSEGSAAGAFTWAGSATGARPSGGSAAGAFTWAGSATGTNRPAVPANLQAVAVSDTQIDLSWDAVTGATGYDIERDGAIIVFDHPTTSYSDTGLAATTEYDYRVRAVG